MEVTPVDALSDNYMYIIADLATKEAMAVDPADADECVALARKLGLTITTVLTTHHHFDHAGGNNNMKKLLGSTLEVVGGDASIQGMTRQVADGDELPLGTGVRVRCVHTPCHTAGHMSYLATANDGSAAVFTGDILFIGGCGRFFEGTPEQMLASSAKLATLDPGTKVYCGHEYTVKNLEFAFDVDPENPDVVSKRTWAEAQRAQGGRTVPSTIGDELKYNPFMRTGTAAVRKYTGGSDDVSVMRILRNKKDSFAGSSRPWIPGGGPLPGL
ncbi:hypothetical protein AB1Y20_017630 [Prymnesium parvum]|uniref:hydroxyacylglutathione hydrolase n=1 Tax=Prymnesium parvum TaxID=97485 RepID=A0AB34JPI7_PRYPA